MVGLRCSDFITSHPPRPLLSSCQRDTLNHLLRPYTAVSSGIEKGDHANQCVLRPLRVSFGFFGFFSLSFK